MVKKLLGVAVVVLVAGGAAFWWFVLRDDAPPPPEFSSLNDAGASTTTGSVPDSLDGTWKVVDADGTFAGFRIKESFLRGLTDHTAVGRSDDVSGSLTVDGTAVTKADITVDLASLEFTDDPGASVANRANALRSKGLETDTFPTATFELTKPIDFGSEPAPGEEVSAQATGDLTIHGVTNPVTFPVKAKLVGDTIEVLASDVPVTLADYDIDKPILGPVASIDDQGSFEFLVVFQQQGAG